MAKTVQNEQQTVEALGSRIKDAGDRVKGLQYFALTNLYKAQGTEKPANGCSEDYWRGANTAFETVLHILGLEGEKFNPFGFMEYVEVGEEVK